MNASRNTLIQIGGYGRSGSTIVDLELSRRFGAHSLGEVRYARKHLDAGYRTCSCGAEFDQCEFWSVFKDDTNLLDAVGVVQGTTLFGSVASLRNSSVKSAVRKTFGALFLHSSGRRILVDSSKTSWGAFLRPFVISQSLKDDADVVFVGVFRDPISVLSSLNRGSNEEMDNENSKSILSGNKRIASPMFKLLIGWSCANIAMLINHFLFKATGRKSGIYAYEDLVKDFSLVVDGCGLPEVEESSLENHLIGGNRLANDKNVRMKAPVAKTGAGIRTSLRIVIKTVLSPVLVLLHFSRART